MIPAVSAKSLVTIMLLGAAMFANASESISMLQLVLMVAGWFASVVGVAAVMRRDVKVLQKQMDEGVKWRESHDQLHSDISKIMGTLTTLSQGMEQRVHRMELTEDNRYRRKADRQG